MLTMPEERSPNNGGCWICHSGNGFADESDMAFSIEWDAFYHPGCLDKHNVDSITEYESQKQGSASIID